MRRPIQHALFFLFLIKCSAAVSSFNLDNCRAGNYFVENYIKYECYEMNNVKGAKIAGCQPSNDLTGTTLEAWETHNEQWFKYHCVIDGMNAQYAVKACLDPVGEVLPVGKTRSFPDGDIFTCFIERNKVKLDHQTTIGCRVGNQVYGDRATWIEQRKDIVTVGFKNKTVGLGIAMQCRKQANDIFTVEFAACLTVKNIYIRLGEYGTVDDEILKCAIHDGKCQLRETRSTETRCSDGNVTYRHNQEWNSVDGVTAFACQFGKIVKKGCLVNGTLIPLFAVRYVQGTAYYCKDGTQIRSFGNLKGCPSSSGEVVPFESRFKEGEKMFSCSFMFDQADAIKVNWIQVGCIFSKNMITINAIQKFGDQYVHCALNGNSGYVAKLMTKVEVEAWLTATKQTWSNIVSGHEGEGKEVQQKIKIIAPLTITTTAVPTQVPTTATNLVTVTTAPTTSTFSTKMTSPVDTVKVQPTANPPVKKCEDLVEDCDLMQGYCATEAEQAVLMRDTVGKSSISSKTKQRMMQFIDIIVSDIGNYANLEDECYQVPDRNLRICENQKELNIKMVRSLCPKTCDLCNEKQHLISSIIKDYTSSACSKRKCRKNGKY